ncbi:MAG: hypothetical protein ACJ8AT_09135 [Hyalangium sp.]|uniref:hypothetical protein n=1 Tax=Hyalangium sp. TaxID=2028555 RepID=UPI00389A7C45
MRAFLLPSLLVVGLGLPALAQAPQEPPASNPSPDESWLSYPGPEAPAPPPDTMPAPPLLPVGSERAPELRTPGGRAPAEPLKLSRVSLYGAHVLEPGKVAAGMTLGFPLASARAVMGVLPRLDVGLGVDSMYGIMNEARVYARFGLVSTDSADVAFSVEAGRAFFIHSPSQEQFGARYFTGRRNWNLAPGFVGSMLLGRRTRGFVDLRYLLAFDTQPFQSDPLGGIPQGVQVGGNFLFRGGLEVPFSERTSYVVSVGGNIHGRKEDAAFMPMIAVGLVAGF